MGTVKTEPYCRRLIIRTEDVLDLVSAHGDFPCTLVFRSFPGGDLWVIRDAEEADEAARRPEIRGSQASRITMSPEGGARIECSRYGRLEVNRAFLAGLGDRAPLSPGEAAEAYRLMTRGDRLGAESLVPPESLAATAAAWEAGGGACPG